MSLPNAIASMLELSFALMRRRQERGGGGDDGGLKQGPDLRYLRRAIWRGRFFGIYGFIEPYLT